MNLPWFRRRFLRRRQLDRMFLDFPDAVLRRVTGRGEWPPYSLRAFVGGARDFDRVGRAFVEEFRSLRLLGAGSRILDAGCGCGRIARALVRDEGVRGLGVSYTGMDIDAASIEWCQRHITPLEGRFTFYQADCYNPSYHPAGTMAAEEYQFPHADESFDAILLTSVFTHLREREAAHYLGEVSRLLAPGGVAYASFFLCGSLAEAAAGGPRRPIRFPYPQGHCAVNREDFPANAVAYEEGYVRRTASEAGLEIIGPPRYGFQDVLLLGKAWDRRWEAEPGAGWHEWEGGRQRWTGREFEVRLRRTQPERRTLRFRFHLPAAGREERKSVRLTATVEGRTLHRGEYATGREHLLVCEIPGALWAEGGVTVQFALDSVYATAAGETRELGLLVVFEEGAGPWKRRAAPLVGGRG